MFTSLYLFNTYRFLDLGEWVVYKLENSINSECLDSIPLNMLSLRPKSGPLKIEMFLNEKDRSHC